MEEERKKSKNVMFEAEQAEQCLLFQKEERRLQLTKEFNETRLKRLSVFKAYLILIRMKFFDQVEPKK